MMVVLSNFRAGNLINVQMSSSLAHQRAPADRQRPSEAHSLFGMKHIPWDDNMVQSAIIPCPLAP